MEEQDIQFVKVKDFILDSKKQFVDSKTEEKIMSIVEKQPENRYLMIVGMYQPQYKISRVKPITEEFIKEILTV